MKMTSELKEIANEYRQNGWTITDETCEKLYEHCERKMTVGGVKDRKAYLPLLFRNELEDYVFRCIVNTVTAVFYEEGEEAHV